jgi:DNA ligase-1
VVCPTLPQYLRLGTNYKSLAAEYVSRGHYDGLVIKDGTAPYTCGLAKEGQIIKVKPSFSLDLRVATIITEFGEKTGRKVYTLQIKHEGKGRGHSFVGSGMPHILPPDLTVGCIVEVEFMGWTEDGHLREPRFKGVRHDKVKADYE